MTRARTPAVEIGLRYARANVLIGPRSETAALYRLHDVNYPWLGVAEKWTVQRQLERLTHVAQADLSLWRLTRGTDPDRYVERHAHAGHSARWQALLDGHHEALGRLDARRTEAYLAVSLDSVSRRRFGAALLGVADRARASLGALPGAGAVAPISHAELTAVTQAERRLLERLAGVVGLRRARTRELEWLLRRAPLRGLAEPALERFWAPDALVLEPDDDGAEPRYEPLGWDLWRLPAAPVLEDPGHPPSLEVQTEHGTSYQAFLAVGALADEPLFPGPGAELLHAPLDALPFGVDAVVHARWLGNREALAAVRRRVVDAEQVYRDQLESRHGPGWQADDDRSLAREYEQVLQSGGRPPMLYATLSLAVAAPSREELERRVEALRSAYGDVQLFRPRGLQERLFYDHLPRADGGRVRDYTQQVSAQQFAAMVPTATVDVGDPAGLYLGYVPSGTRRPVFYDPTAPSRESRASAVLLAGTLGSGKTFAAQVIAHAAHLRGSLVVDFDPKPDHGWSDLPDVADDLRVVELTGAAEQAGRLDPLAIGLPELREELTVSYLLELLRDPPRVLGARDRPRGPRHGPRRRAQHPHGDRAVARIGHRGRRTDRRRAGRDLRLRPRAPGLRPRRRRERVVGLVITIRTPGLTLPEPGVSRETYTRAERISVATLSLVAALALRLVSEDRSRHKIVAAGRGVVPAGLRAGPSGDQPPGAPRPRLQRDRPGSTQRLADLGDLSRAGRRLAALRPETQTPRRGRAWPDRPRPEAPLGSARWPNTARAAASCATSKGASASCRSTSPSTPTCGRARQHAEGDLGMRAEALRRWPRPVLIGLASPWRSCCSPHPLRTAASDVCGNVGPGAVGSAAWLRPLPARQLRAGPALRRGQGDR